MNKILLSTLNASLLWLLSSVAVAQPATETTPPMPVAVTQLTAESSFDSIAVRWRLANHKNLRQILLYRKAYPLPLQVAKGLTDKSEKIDPGVVIAQLDAAQKQYRDEKVQAGDYYYYRLVLEEHNGHKSKLSRPALAVLKDITPPQPPQLQALTALDTQQFEIRWQASTSADVVAYRIYRATLKGTPQVIHIMNLQQAGDKAFGLTLKNSGNPQFEYRYSVVAVDSAGNRSAASAPQVLRMPDMIAPQPPALLNAEQVKHQVLLSWLPGRENDMGGYRLYRRDNSAGSPFKPLHKGLLKQATYTDGTAQPLSAYSYRVAAVDRYGNESKATRGILFRTTAPLKALPAPQALRLQSDEQGVVRLSWQAVPHTMEAVSYLVLRSHGSDDQVLSGLLSSNHYIDHTIQLGVAYRYKVQAISASGQRSPESEAVMWHGGKQ